MKRKVKVCTNAGGFIPQIIKQGDWIDLRIAKTTSLECPKVTRVYNHKDGSSRPNNIIFNVITVDLGVSMKLPDGCEAIIAPRSSSFKRWGFIFPNSIGVIDNSYGGTNDTWKAILMPTRNTTIVRGERICQFKIQLSQKASIWQKIKWFFTTGFEFELVDNLEGEDRGGIGTTGAN